jgi:hypothetical protein
MLVVRRYFPRHVALADRFFPGAPGGRSPTATVPSAPAPRRLAGDVSLDHRVQDGDPDAAGTGDGVVEVADVELRSQVRLGAHTQPDELGVADLVAVGFSGVGAVTVDLACDGAC